jgi:hypothetical protein
VSTLRSTKLLTSLVPDPVRGLGLRSLSWLLGAGDRLDWIERP